ncbi:hypothetical protein [Rhizobacter sp. Root1221]|uniref:hypothetical protein n=1 Tax=Rhizobacter sp. Root1221 TaxID=1736433 RepID=UPI000700C55C|nr:hypothetical protein [Rhizobacter sp. Root1221]KQW02198.1 hypothetical protein ASC87_13280 [Rhizobacter sp. Root1221]
MIRLELTEAQFTSLLRHVEFALDEHEYRVVEWAGEDDVETEATRAQLANDCLALLTLLKMARS